MNRSPGRRHLWLAVPVIAAALLAAAVPASARPATPPSACAASVTTGQDTTLTQFAKTNFTTPARVIGWTFECGGNKLAARFRAYVNHGDWKRNLPVNVALYTGYGLIEPGHQAS